MAETLTIERLEDWVRAGAHWRVLYRGRRHTIVELQECTGIPVGRLESDDPALTAYLADVETDLDLLEEGSDAAR